MSDSSANQKTPQMSLVQMLRMVPAAYHPGWGGPEYTSWKDEQMSWKKTCYIGDWSFPWNPLTEGLLAFSIPRSTASRTSRVKSLGGRKT